MLSIETAGGGKVPEQQENFDVMALVVWFGANVCFGALTKKILTEIYYPWTIAAIQMISGFLYLIPWWYHGLRKIPELDWKDIKALFPIASCQIGVHVASTFATGLGRGLPIAHVIKAFEPIVIFALDYKRGIPTEALLFGIVLIIAGTILPYWKYLQFDPLSIAAALVLVVCSSTRVVLAKHILNKRNIGKNLDAKNLYAIISIMVSIVIVPTAILSDGFSMFDVLRNEFSSEESFHLKMLLFQSGFFYYLFNEASFVILNSVTPVEHATLNLLRRPVVVVCSIFMKSISRLFQSVRLRDVPFAYMAGSFKSSEWLTTTTIGDVFCSENLKFIMCEFITAIPWPAYDSILGAFLAFSGYAVSHANSFADFLFYQQDEDEQVNRSQLPPWKKASTPKKKFDHRYSVAQ
jgi:solute carrier family 35 protein E1